MENCVITKEMAAFAKAADELGIDVEIRPSDMAYCTDNKFHYGTCIYFDGVVDGEGENYEFIFNPDGEMVPNWEFCPVEEDE